MNPSNILTDPFGNNQPSYDPKLMGLQSNHSARLGLGATENFINSTPAIRRNITAIILTYPLAYEYLKNGEMYKRLLESFIERASKTIEGLTSTLTAEFAELDAGPNEKFSVFKNVTREPSKPTHGAYEIDGYAYTTLFEDYFKDILGNPDSGDRVPNIAYIENVDDIDMYHQGFKTFTTLYFETDNLGKRVVRAWLCGNMQPSNTPDIIGKKDITQGGEEIDISIAFPAITIHNSPVLQKFAQDTLDAMRGKRTPPEMGDIWVNEDQIPADFYSK